MSEFWNEIVQFFNDSGLAQTAPWILAAAVIVIRAGRALWNLFQRRRESSRLKKEQRENEAAALRRGDHLPVSPRVQQLLELFVSTPHETWEVTDETDDHYAFAKHKPTGFAIDYKTFTNFWVNEVPLNDSLNRRESSLLINAADCFLNEYVRQEREQDLEQAFTKFEAGLKKV